MFVMAAMFCSCGNSQKSENSEPDSLKIESIQEISTDSILVDTVALDTIVL